MCEDLTNQQKQLNETSSIIRSPVLLGLEGFWNIHIVALLVLLSRMSAGNIYQVSYLYQRPEMFCIILIIYCSKTLDTFAQDYVKPVGYDSRRHSPDKTYGSGVDEDEELMEQVGWVIPCHGERKTFTSQEKNSVESDSATQG